MSRNTFFLDPVAPFRLDLTVWVLRRRPDNAIDRWDGATYRRALAALESPFAPRKGVLSRSERRHRVARASDPVEVAVVQTGPPEAPRLRVAVDGAPLGSELKRTVTAALQRLLGLRTAMAAFYHLASRDAELRPLVERFRGMKPPRFTSVFESVINAIASQQVSRTLAIRLLNRLTVSYGVAFRDGDATMHTFPRADDLAALRPADLRRLGFSRKKGLAMIELARSIAEGGLDLEGLEELPDELAVKRLRGLRGVGPWTTEYVLLRGLGRTHVFPGGVVGARDNLRRWLRPANPLDDAAVRGTLARWHPVWWPGLLSPAARQACGGGINGGIRVAGTRPQPSRNRAKYLTDGMPMAHHLPHSLACFQSPSQIEERAMARPHEHLNLPLAWWLVAERKRCPG